MNSVPVSSFLFVMYRAPEERFEGLIFWEIGDHY
jgi:hypothetical protein